MLLIMSAVLSVLLHVLLFPVEMISMLFLSQETVDTSGRLPLRRRLDGAAFAGRRVPLLQRRHV